MTLLHVVGCCWSPLPSKHSVATTSYSGMCSSNKRASFFSKQQDVLQNTPLIWFDCFSYRWWTLVYLPLAMIWSTSRLQLSTLTWPTKQTTTSTILGTRLNKSKRALRSTRHATQIQGKRLTTVRQVPDTRSTLSRVVLHIVFVKYACLVIELVPVGVFDRGLPQCQMVWYILQLRFSSIQMFCCSLYSVPSALFVVMFQPNYCTPSVRVCFEWPYWRRGHL